MTTIYDFVNIFKCVFVNKNFYFLIQILLKFIPALAQVMAWHWTGDKSLLYLMLIKNLHIAWPGNELT